MTKINRKITVITNLLLVVIIAVVFSVGFVPTAIIPIQSSNEIKAIYNGNRKNKNVSIMINVYENTAIVDKMIEVFDSHGVKATFFVGGCWADDNGDTLLKIVNSGHELANHGYFHKNHKNLNYEQNKQEITLTNIIIKALSGVTPNLFAPPSGSYSSVTLNVVADLNMKVIMWSKDTIDWRDNDENKLFARATNNITNGDLVLMHPKEHTLNILPRVLQFYKNQGFNVVTVSENLMQ